jgi:hypothetical protein
VGAEKELSSDLKKDLGAGASSTVGVTAEFVESGTQPHLKKWSLVCQPYSLEVQYSNGVKGSVLKIKTPSASLTILEVGFLHYGLPVMEFLPMISRLTVDEELQKRYEVKVQGESPRPEELNLLNSIGARFRGSLGGRPFAFAPIRTRPRRTYDPLKEEPTPEGSHVPMILARLFSSDPTEWQQLRESLVTFGKASGLFSDVDVRRMGRKPSDPFQIAVKVLRPAFNIVDVGYGVSQVLPIVVDTLRERRGSTFLLQQPEVHLHPKAQAELGSFLGRLAVQQKKRFIIETHSDYLLDRVRMDVRDGKSLKPSDVSILYFERKQSEVEIHSMSLDMYGNIINPPACYRQFFLQEDRRLLGG